MPVVHVYWLLTPNKCQYLTSRIALWLTRGKIAIVADPKYTQTEKDQEKAEDDNHDLKSYIKNTLFLTVKFVTGLAALDLGQPPSQKVLSYLNITDEEERAKKWREVKKLVSDGVNTKRSDISAAMNKVFLGIY